MARSSPPGKSPAALAAVTVLLVVAIAGTLWVPIYARTAPKLGNFPFFYWFQFMWLLVVAVLAWLCYLLLRTRPGPGSSPGAQAGTGNSDAGGAEK